VPSIGNRMKSIMNNEYIRKKNRNRCHWLIEVRLNSLLSNLFSFSLVCSIGNRMKSIMNNEYIRKKIAIDPRSSNTTAVYDRIRPDTTPFTIVYNENTTVNDRVSSYYLSDDLRSYFVVIVYDEIRPLTLVVYDRILSRILSYTTAYYVKIIVLFLKPPSDNFYSPSSISSQSSFFRPLSTRNLNFQN
jgi:hypothetical protein